MASSTSSASTSLSTRTPSQSKMTALNRLGRFPRGQEFAHPAQRLDDVLGGVGVGQAQIAFAQDAEVRTADQSHAGFVQQRIGERLGLPAGLLDVGESIEGAGGT